MQLTEFPQVNLDGRGGDEYRFSDSDTSGWLANSENFSHSPELMELPEVSATETRLCLAK